MKGDKQMSTKQIPLIIISCLLTIALVAKTQMGYAKVLPPEDVIKKVITLLNTQEYKSLYELISSEYKREISESEFIEFCSHMLPEDVSIKQEFQELRVETLTDRKCQIWGRVQNIIRSEGKTRVKEQQYRWFLTKEENNWKLANPFTGIPYWWYYPEYREKLEPRVQIVKEYCRAWLKKDYREMYQFLPAKAKKNIDFERYKKLVKDKPAPLKVLLIQLRPKNLQEVTIGYWSEAHGRSYSYKENFILSYEEKNYRIIGKWVKKWVEHLEATPPEERKGSYTRSTTPLSPAESLTNARAHYKKGNYRQALAFYRTIVEDFPDSKEAPQAYVGTGKCYIIFGMAEGRTSREKSYYFFRAVSMFQQFMEKYPLNINTVELYLAVANEFLKLGYVENAISIFKEITNKFPNTEYASQAQRKSKKIKDNEGIARIKKKQGKYKEALQIYNQLIKKYPFRADIFYCEIADCYINLGKDNKAISSYQKAIDSTSDKRRKAAAHFFLGRLYLKMEAYNKALQEFQVVLQLVPKNHMLVKPSQNSMKYIERILAKKPLERRKVVSQMGKIKVFTRQQLVKLIGIPLVALAVLIYLSILIVRRRKKK